MIVTIYRLSPFMYLLEIDLTSKRQLSRMSQNTIKTLQLIQTCRQHEVKNRYLSRVRTVRTSSSRTPERAKGEGRRDAKKSSREGSQLDDT